MKLLRYFRKHGTADHCLYDSIYQLRGWTYRDRSCLPPIITDPEGRQVTETECLATLTTTRCP